MDARVDVKAWWLVMGTLAVLFMVGMVPGVEARVRVRSSGGSSHSAPSAGRTHAPAPKPAAPQTPSATPSPAVNAAGRSVSPSMPGVAADNRGFFGRGWDWLLGRRPPTPAPTPQAPAPGRASVVATAPSTAVPTPSVMVPLPGAPARPVATPALATAQQEKDPQRAGAPGAPSAIAAAAGGAAGGTALAAALQHSFGKKGPNGRESERGGPATPPANPDRPVAKPLGYVLHLTNGRSLAVAQYEDKGDQVLIAQPQGTFSLPKALIARIEPRTTEIDLSSVSGPR